MVGVDYEYMKISSSMTIHAPISQVFDVFTDLGKIKDRISGIKELEVLEGENGNMKVGTKWKETREMMGKDSTEIMWVSELTENKSYSVEAQSHGTKYHSLYSFTENGDSTDVTWVFTGTPQTLPAKLMSVLSYIFAGSLKKMLDQDMEELKAVCES